MSWWVKECILQDNEGYRVFNLECDDVASLPAYNSQSPDFIISRGSKAFVLATSETYCLNSTNQWVKLKDSGGGGSVITLDAEYVGYDNTDSGLTADNVQDAIDELESENGTQDNALAELYGEQAKDQILFQGLINKGAKNLLNNSEAVSQTVGGVTFTLNADGSVTANGTKSNNNWFIFSTGNSLKAGTYVLYDGLPTDTLNCQLFISTTNSFSSAIMSTGAGSRPLTKTLTQDYNGLYYAIRIASGTVVNNLTFYPMLCTKAEWDVTQLYEPYAPTNRQLYEMILALQGNRSLNLSNNLRSESIDLGNDELNLRSEELDTNFDLMNSLEEDDERDDLDDI